MKVKELISASCIRKISQRIKSVRSCPSDCIVLNKSNRVMRAQNKSDCIQYAKIFMNSSSANPNFRIPFIEKLGAFILGINTPVKKLRIVKDGNNKIIGGYMSTMRTPEEFFISSLAVANPGRSSKVLTKIYKDMVSTIKMNNSKTVSCLVSQDASYLVNLYKKLGFRIDDIADPLEFNIEHNKVLYHMTMSADDFCKIL